MNLPSLSEEKALTLTFACLSVSILLQTIEQLIISRSPLDRRVWDPHFFKQELSWIPRWILSPILPLLGRGPSTFSPAPQRSTSPYRHLLHLRLIAAISLGVMALVTWFFVDGSVRENVPLHLILLAFLSILLLSSALMSLRYRGTFNGGSDLMTAVVLTGSWIGSLLPPSLGGVKLGLLWISVQSLLSYWIAGLVKAQHLSWWTGRELRLYFGLSSFRPGINTLSLTSARPALIALSWSTLLFECGFPIVLWRPAWVPGMMGLAALFHLGIALFLGLNRFFFAWTASFPALYWATTQSSSPIRRLFDSLLLQ